MPSDDATGEGGRTAGKCRHARRFNFTEWGTSHTSHDYEDGVLSHNSDLDDYTGRFSFRCLECGYTTRGNYLSKRLPKWLKERFATATSDDPDPEGARP